jgi:recombination protein RecA
LSRQRLIEDDDAELAPTAASYFLSEHTETFSSGCTVLDCALGGGWPLKRMFNIMGDKSTGKTLLMIEACAQFLRHHKNKARVIYAEAEAAFDAAYAEALGLPVDRIEFLEDDRQVRTVEDLENALKQTIESANGLPTLFVVDSYDALSDDAELARDTGDKATYGTAKAKFSSTMFRKLIKQLQDKNITLGIVSQIRQNIGVSYGSTYVRSGGKALDFYATHIVYLQKLKSLKKTRDGIDRIYGVTVRAKVEKNKLSMPYREAEFPILFGYGVENMISIVDWLVTNKRHSGAFESEKEAAALLRRLDKMSASEYKREEGRLIGILRKEWKHVESLFIPPRCKYGEAE